MQHSHCSMHVLSHKTAFLFEAASSLLHQHDAGGRQRQYRHTGCWHSIRASSLPRITCAGESRATLSGVVLRWVKARSMCKKIWSFITSFLFDGIAPTCTCSTHTWQNSTRPASSYAGNWAKKNVSDCTEASGRPENALYSTIHLSTRLRSNWLQTCGL